VDSDIVSDVSTNLQKRNRALSPRPGPRMCAAFTNFSDAFGCFALHAKAVGNPLKNLTKILGRDRAHGR